MLYNIVLHRRAVLYNIMAYDNLLSVTIAVMRWNNFKWPFALCGTQKKKKMRKKIQLKQKS